MMLNFNEKLYLGFVIPVFGFTMGVRYLSTTNPNLIGEPPSQSRWSKSTSTEKTADAVDR